MIRKKNVAKHALHTRSAAPTPLRDEELGAVSGAGKKGSAKPATTKPTENLTFTFSQVYVTYVPID